MRLPVSPTGDESNSTSGRVHHHADIKGFVIDDGVEDAVEGGVEGGSPPFEWHVEDGPQRNAQRLGDALAAFRGLYRNKNGEGLLEVREDGSTQRIVKAADLFPIITDRLRLTVYNEGKRAGEFPKVTTVNAVLRSETFLDRFVPLDFVTTLPLYLGDFELTNPGYNDGVLFLGRTPVVAQGTETIDRFLDVMAFADESDRTNAVAAALTVRLRNYWHGGKPLVFIASTKSHSGKGTISDFIRGEVPKAEGTYQANDWAMKAEIRQQLDEKPDAGVIDFDNTRLDGVRGGRSKFISSAFIESFVTTSEVTLASATGGSPPLILPNRFVVCINTNDGALSPDLINRALYIGLDPKGNVHENETPIGNPKLEYLPQNREVIEAEFRGMIERWKDAGRPLDNRVRHGMSPWAKTVGGILAVAGYPGFLGNAVRCKSNDVKRQALATLGAENPGDAPRTEEWAKRAVRLGVEGELLTKNQLKTDKSRTAAMGTVLSAYEGETFEAKTETHAYILRLVGGKQRRWDGELPHKRYRFEVIEERRLFDDEN